MPESPIAINYANISDQKIRKVLQSLIKEYHLLSAMENTNAKRVAAKKNAYYSDDKIEKQSNSVDGIEAELNSFADSPDLETAQSIWRDLKFNQEALKTAYGAGKSFDKKELRVIEDSRRNTALAGLKVKDPQKKEGFFGLKWPQLGGSKEKLTPQEQSRQQFMVYAYDFKQFLATPAEFDEFGITFDETEFSKVYAEAQQIQPESDREGFIFVEMLARYYNYIMESAEDEQESDLLKDKFINILVTVTINADDVITIADFIYDPTKARVTPTVEEIRNVGNQILEKFKPESDGDGELGLDAELKGLEPELAEVDAEVNNPKFQIILFKGSSGFLKDAEARIKKVQAEFDADPKKGVDFKNLTPNERKAYLFGLIVYLYGQHLKVSFASNPTDFKVVSDKLRDILGPQATLLHHYDITMKIATAIHAENTEHTIIDEGADALKRLNVNTGGDVEKKLAAIIPIKYFRESSKVEQGEITSVYNATEKVPNGLDILNTRAEAVARKVPTQLFAGRTMEDVKNIARWYILKQKFSSPTFYDEEGTINSVTGMLAVEGMKMRRDDQNLITINTAGETFNSAAQYISTEWKESLSSANDKYFQPWLNGVTQTKAPDTAFNSMSLSNLAAVGKAYRDSVGGGDSNPPENNLDFSRDIQPELLSTFDEFKTLFGFTQEQINLVTGEAGLPPIKLSAKTIFEAAKREGYDAEQTKALFCIESLTCLLKLVNSDNNMVPGNLKVAMTEDDALTLKDHVEDKIGTDLGLQLGNGSRFAIKLLTMPAKVRLGQEYLNKSKQSDF